MPLILGIEDVNRAFAHAGKRLAKEKTPLLQRAAEPVRRDAELLASARITNITLPWARMRIGVTKRAVYVAPKRRSSKFLTRRRPNLADLLRGEAMEPALDQNTDGVIRDMNELLSAIETEFN